MSAARPVAAEFPERPGARLTRGDVMARRLTRSMVHCVSGGDLARRPHAGEPPAA
jgi:hypothetical protein